MLIIDTYFELFDKSGDFLRSGTCGQKHLVKLQNEIDSIGGSIYAESL